MSLLVGRFREDSHGTHVVEDSQGTHVVDLTLALNLEHMIQVAITKALASSDTHWENF